MPCHRPWHATASVATNPALGLPRAPSPPAWHRVAVGWGAPAGTSPWGPGDPRGAMGKPSSAAILRPLPSCLAAAPCPSQGETEVFGGGGHCRGGEHIGWVELLDRCPSQPDLYIGHPAAQETLNVHCSNLCSRCCYGRSYTIYWPGGLVWCPRDSWGAGQHKSIEVMLWGGVGHGWGTVGGGPRQGR